MDLTNAFSDDIATTKTEAPTSGKTKSAEEQVEEQKALLTEEELDFVTLVHQHYGTVGTMLSEDLAAHQYEVPVETYRRLVKSPPVVTALAERGIAVKVKEGWQQHGLTPVQLVVANAMLDLLDGRSYKKKLQDYGISTAKWQAWLTQPAFAKYLDDHTQHVLKHGQHEAAMSIMDGVRAGNEKMIRLYLEYTDRFVSKTSATVAQSDGIDAKRIIASIIQIIVEEVEDRDVAAAIADRIKGLISANTIASQLVDNEPIVQPVIATPRAITPAMERAMDQGVGVNT